MLAVERPLYEAAWPDRRSAFREHAEQRLRDRGIPLYVVDLLLSYGLEENAGEGRRSLRFARESIADMRREMPASAWAAVRKYLHVYMIVDFFEDEVVTVVRGNRCAKKRFRLKAV